MAARATSRTGKRRTLFVAVGLPGSGKTTFAHKLRPEDFLSISQDKMNISFKALKRYIQVQRKSTDRHLYVDSCNHTVVRRQELADLGLRLGFQVVFVIFDYSVDVCKANILERIRKGTPHPSVNDEATAETAISTICKTWQHVSDMEKRTINAVAGVSLITIDSFARADALAQSFNERA